MYNNASRKVYVDYPTAGGYDKFAVTREAKGKGKFSSRKTEGGVGEINFEARWSRERSVLGKKTFF